MATQAAWQRGTFEHAVEGIYTSNAVGFDGSHDGYLNFGLWGDDVTDYVAAAENLVRTLGRSLGLRPGARLLDVACGRGTQDLFLDREFGPLEIDAVDVTEIHVLDGKRRAETAGRGASIRFHHATATALPFADASFTHALAIEGPIHFDTREQFVREAYRCLEPGGHFALADYVVKRAPRDAVSRSVLRATAALWRIPIANQIDITRYQRMMCEAGFSDVHIHEVGARTIPGYFVEQSRPAFRARKVREQGFLWGGIGFVVDLAVYAAFKLGLIEYVLVTARKAT